MKILLTGGNDVLQHSIADACVSAGHSVQVLTAAPHTAKPWPAQVEPMACARATAATLRQFATGCHVAVAVDPALTPSVPASYARCAELALEAAGSAGVRQLIVVTGLGDATKRTGETDVSGATIPGARAGIAPGAVECSIIRTEAPYGISDDPLTLFLIMMRSLPAVPLMPDSIVMRPLWHEDLAAAIAASVAVPAGSDVATIVGPESVTATELYERMSALIDRRPVRVPVPEFLASFGRRVADALSIPLAGVTGRFAYATPASHDGGATTSPRFADVIRTPLTEGLPRLIRELSEVTPQEGVGTLQVKTFSTTLRQSEYGAAAVITLLRARFADMMPVEIGVEPAVPARTLELDAVMTIALPGRGHVQIRVVDVQPGQVTVATLRGHTVAGIVRFTATPVPDGVRFEVMTCDRAANAADWVALTLGGTRVQDANWTAVVKNVSAAAGARPAGVRVDSTKLSGDDARAMEESIADLLRRRDPAGDLVR